MEDRMGKTKATRKNEKSIPQASVEAARDQRRGESEPGLPAEKPENDLPAQNENESMENEPERQRRAEAEREASESDHLRSAPPVVAVAVLVDLQPAGGFGSHHSVQTRRSTRAPTAWRASRRPTMWHVGGTKCRDCVGIPLWPSQRKSGRRASQLCGRGINMYCVQCGNAELVAQDARLGRGSTSCEVCDVN